MARLVYTTGPGPRPKKEPESEPEPDAKPLPGRIVAKLRIERAGRGGKTVTVIDGLPEDAPLLAALASELKRACGSGGSVGAGAIELQGDVRERVRALLARKGFGVKG